MSTGPAYPTAESGARPPSRVPFRVLLVSGLTLGVLLLSLLPHFLSSSELVRLRNAMLYEPAPAQAKWTPETRPPKLAVGKPRMLRSPWNEAPRLALERVQLQLLATVVLLPLVLVAWVVWRRAERSGGNLQEMKHAS